MITYYIIFILTGLLATWNKEDIEGQKTPTRYFTPQSDGDSIKCTPEFLENQFCEVTISGFFLFICLLSRFIFPRT